MQPSALLSGEPIADRRADYATGYAEAGDFAAAADLMRQALDLAPRWAAGWVTLGGYLDKSDAREAALDALRRAAELDPEDRLGAGAKLAALGAAPVPETLPPAFVATLFDQYADRFERQLRDKLAYRAPEELLAAIDEAAPGERFSQVLDLGCGTGLMGELLRGRSVRLVGLDLSPRMLAKARLKDIYDELREADLLFLEPAEVFDLAVAADVLNYVGDLSPVFARVHAALRPGALFAFTVEAHDGSEPFVLGETMRYAHRAEAVERALLDARFARPRRRAVALREDRGEPVRGWIFVSRTA